MPTMLVPVPIEVRRRLWLVFFGEAEQGAWWSRFLRPGFRHVSAAAWFDDQERWVYINPARTGTVILLYRENEFDGRLGQLVSDSTLVLRVPSNELRTTTPFGWWCTGGIKALLGIRAGALSPWQLSRHLLRHGAEIVEIPRARSGDDRHFQETENTAGRPRDRGRTPPRAAARGGRPDQGDAGSIARGDNAA